MSEISVSRFGLSLTALAFFIIGVFLIVDTYLDGRKRKRRREEPPSRTSGYGGVR